MMEKYELNAKIKSGAKKHKMLIPCFNGKVLESGVEINFLEPIEKVWNPKSKAKKVMDSLSIDQLTPIDQINKIDIVKEGFKYNLNTMINQAMGYLNSKYFMVIKNNPELVALSKELYDIKIKESRERYEAEQKAMKEESEGNVIIPIDLSLRNNGYSQEFNLYIDDELSLIEYVQDIMYMNPGFRNPFKNDISNDCNGLDIIYECSRYTTNDPTVVEDSVALYMSAFLNVYTKRLTGRLLNKKVLDIITPIYNDLLTEMYDTLYIVFSKATVMANQYYEYSCYKAVENITNEEKAIEAEEE